MISGLLTGMLQNSALEGSKARNIDAALCVRTAERRQGVMAYLCSGLCVEMLQKA